MRRMILTTSLALALSTTALAGQVYRWVDAQGVTHFSEQPPQGQQATTVNTATPPPPSTEPKPTPTFQNIADPEQAAIDAKVKQEVAEQEAQRRKYCESQRNNLAQLENNPRVRVEDGGEMRRLGEEERQQRIAESKKAIEENCK
ncbi:DUF4124 domain-containing protein [Pseudomonas daroniae]|uniref:DUF4124 domain-containing protein n=1 Tax=Phytopseudomonas daroniae TaxID=2487519 RepID=A0A4Q9QNW4_9GAMM|nr:MULTISPECIES: DUF4124 domain-containing protein [Pseudomonas]TBU79874.1 DUF4124 domain-containing protein [Pseudomonas daroniae]TBU82407.1 DUF4124 domain-containing protein [Pseudomonas sp. FRB 228]TBU91880.1 DUF4124 domain-containing protein [Pseudomonas daroniae]